MHSSIFALLLLVATVASLSAIVAAAKPRGAMSKCRNHGRHMTPFGAAQEPSFITPNRGSVIFVKIHPFSNDLLQACWTDAATGKAFNHDFDAPKNSSLAQQRFSLMDSAIDTHNRLFHTFVERASQETPDAEAKFESFTVTHRIDPVNQIMRVLADEYRTKLVFVSDIERQQCHFVSADYRNDATGKFYSVIFCDADPTRRDDDQHWFYEFQLSPTVDTTVLQQRYLLTGVNSSTISSISSDWNQVTKKFYVAQAVAAGDSATGLPFASLLQYDPADTAVTVPQSLDLSAYIPAYTSAGASLTVRVRVDQYNGRIFVAITDEFGNPGVRVLLVVQVNSADFSSSTITDISGKSFGQWDFLRFRYFQVHNDMVITINSKESPRLIAFDSNAGLQSWQSDDEIIPSPFDLGSVDFITQIDPVNHAHKCFGWTSFYHEVCSEAGICTGTDFCECNHHFYGPKCDQYECFGVHKDSANTCSGFGKCASPNKCECKSDAYSGARCHQWKCFGVSNLAEDQVCGGKGSCVDVDKCQCQEGYANSASKVAPCSVPLCFNRTAEEKTVCNGYGTCGAPNNCTCSENVTGAQCQLFLCAGKLSNDSSVCNGNGRCSGPNTCSCSLMYYGPQCENKSMGTLLFLLIGGPIFALVLIGFIALFVVVTVWVTLKKRKHGTYTELGGDAMQTSIQTNGAGYGSL